MTPKVKTTTDLVPNGYFTSRSGIQELTLVIGWERVSTDHQDMARQDADLERLRQIHSLQYHRIVKLELSGRHVDGDPEVQAVLNEVANNPMIRGVAVSSLDRLFRHERYDSGKILDIFKDNHKVIYSAKEGLVDPDTSSGYMLCMMAMIQSGLEFREIRRRSMDQKAVYRLRGWNVAGGPHATPRGVIFERIKVNGRTAGGTWRYDGNYSEKIKKAMYLLLEMGSRPNFEELLRLIGGGFTSAFGLKRAMQNRIWIGERVYEFECSGPEFMPDPKKRRGGRKPLKKRRPAVRVAEPLVVKIPLEPLVPVEVFNKVQEIINGVHTNHERARIANADRSRFLANGLIWCSCGKILYVQYGHDAKNDNYWCSSQSKQHHKENVSCGASRIKRVDVEHTLVELFTSSVLRGEVIAAIEARLHARQGRTDTGKVVRENKLAELKDRRETVNEMREFRKIDRADYLRRLERIETEEKALLASAPPAEVPYDPVDTARGLVRIFSGLGALPFAKQREVLRAAVSRITINGSSIMSVEFAGGWLTRISGPIIGKTPGGEKSGETEGSKKDLTPAIPIANGNGATSPLSRWSKWDCCAAGIPGPDLTVKLSKPLQIKRSQRSVK